MREIWRGFRFGMLLQLAVGPVCLTVFSTAAAQGFWPAFRFVLGVALVDGVYLTLSGLGAAKLLAGQKTARLCRGLGAAVLVLFGLDAIAGALGMSLLPAVRLFSANAAAGEFMRGILLTASNPLTILFWGGVFSAQLADRPLTGARLAGFGAGCVLSTLGFLSAVAAAAGFAGGFLPQTAIRLLNAGVGVALLVFAVRLARPKAKAC